jgi:hypothetical protein
MSRRERGEGSWIAFGFILGVLALGLLGAKAGVWHKQPDQYRVYHANP